MAWLQTGAGIITILGVVAAAVLGIYFAYYRRLIRKRDTD